MRGMYNVRGAALNVEVVHIWSRTEHSTSTYMAPSSVEYPEPKHVFLHYVSTKSV